MPIRVTRVTHRLPELRAGMRPKAVAVVSKTLHDIEGGWKERVRVDTGALRNSVHVVMTNDLSGEVVSDVAHAIPNEFGTYKMSAQPAAIPAAESARGPFIAAMKQIATG